MGSYRYIHVALNCALLTDHVLTDFHLIVSAQGSPTIGDIYKEDFPITMLYSEAIWEQGFVTRSLILADALLYLKGRRACTWVLRQISRTHFMSPVPWAV